MVNINCQNKTIATEVAILVALMLNRGHPGIAHVKAIVGPSNRQTNKACSHCRSQNPIVQVNPIVLDGSMQQHAAASFLLDD
jgi:hypothetical protein